jgi:hypothetical protein
MSAAHGSGAKVRTLPAVDGPMWVSRWRRHRGQTVGGGLWLCLSVPVQTADRTPAWLTEVRGIEVLDATVLDHAPAPIAPGRPASHAETLEAETGSSRSLPCVLQRRSGRDVTVFFGCPIPHARKHAHLQVPTSAPKGVFALMVGHCSAGATEGLPVLAVVATTEVGCPSKETRHSWSSALCQRLVQAREQGRVDPYRPGRLHVGS